jgi:peptidoglycan/xylan/chitin deacetylase (PgdA/CDA1 family)
MLSRVGLALMAEKILQMTLVEVRGMDEALRRPLSTATNLGRLVFSGIWAATVGTKRLLALFAKYNIKTTWFIPGHSLESFPEDMAAVRDAGHEIGLHGYSHENPVDMTIEQQRDVLDKTYKMITEFAGKPPRGNVAPW